MRERESDEQRSCREPTDPMFNGDTVVDPLADVRAL
jgi:hypothetical protein